MTVVEIFEIIFYSISSLGLLALLVAGIVSSILEHRSERYDTPNLFDVLSSIDDKLGCIGSDTSYIADHIKDNNNDK